MKKKLTFAVLVFSFSFINSQAQDSWTQRANLGGSERSTAFSFTIGSKAYIGGGSKPGSTLEAEFWEYDPATNVWTQKANIPNPRYHAVGFSVGSKGYMGTGEYPAGVYLNDFWEYNPTSNAWTQKANFAGTGRAWAVGFNIGTKGYIGTGYRFPSSTVGKEFWEYDPASDSWTQKADFGGTSRQFAVGFSIGTKGYIGTGHDVFGDKRNDFWEYDQSTNIWTQKTNFPGIPRAAAIGFSIGTKGYIGTGTDNNVVKKDMWEYNPASDSWTQKADLTGVARSVASSFVVGLKGYVGLGSETINNTASLKDLWEYTPSGLLTSSVSGTFFCNASLLNVSYNTTPGMTFNSGNVFTAQISNSSGGFSGAYYNIGSLTSTATSGTINAQIPSFVSAGSNYRIRVISSNPAYNGNDNGTNLTMGGVYPWTGDLWTSGDQTVYLIDQNQGYNYICEYTTAYFRVDGATSASQYALASGNVTWNFGVSYPGYIAFYMPPGSYAIFTVTINSGGCTHVIYFNFAATSCAGRSYYTIAPNPVGSELNLYADGESPKNEKPFDRVIQQVIILDKSGNELRRQNYPSNTKKITLHVDDLSPDIYVARIFDGKKWTSVKFIKK